MIRLFLLRILESYFRRPLLNLLPIAVMIGIAGIFIVTAEPTYNASGTLFVQDQTLVQSLNEISLDGRSFWTTPADAFNSQLAQLLETEAFIRSLIQGTNLESQLAADPETTTEIMDEVRSTVQVEVLGDSLVRLGADYSDPQVAYQLANRLVEAYVAWKFNSDFQDSSSAQQFFAEMIPAYQEELEQTREDLRLYLEQYPVPIRGERPEDEALEVERLQSAIQQAEEQLQDVMAKEESARLLMIQAEQNIRQAYIVIDAPVVPTEPLTGLRTLALQGLIFVAVGIFMSIIGVVGSALLDRSLRFPSDVQVGTHLPVLATIPIHQESDAPDLQAALDEGKSSLKETKDANLSQSVQEPLSETLIN